MSLIHRGPKQPPVEPVEQPVAIAEPTVEPLDTIVAEQKAAKEAASAQAEPETEAQFIERRLREENTERFRKEFQQSEVLRKRREIVEAEEAKNRAASAERDRIDNLSIERRHENADTETCPVCGRGNVPKVSVSHVVWGTDDRCIRKPKAAKASGLLTADQWDTLSPEEIKNGFVIPQGAMLSNVQLLKKNTPELVPGTINPLLRTT